MLGNKLNDVCLDTLYFLGLKYFWFRFVSVLMKELKYFLNWGSSFWLTLFWVCSLELLSIIIVSANWGSVFNLPLYNNLNNLFCHFVLVQVVKNWIFSHRVGWKAFQCRVFRKYFFEFELVFCSYLFVSLLAF